VNIKPWQIFVFSLVPVALAFAGVIGGSFHGSDSAKERFAEAPGAQPTTPPGGPGATPPSGGGGATTFTLVAKNILFDKRSLTVPANTEITIELDNQDPGVLHNVAVYRSKSSTTNPLVPGSTSMAPFAGPGTKTLSFKTPAAGTYFFRCDVHPDTMNGSFIVR
jgi:plastocyanin